MSAKTWRNEGRAYGRGGGSQSASLARSDVKKPWMLGLLGVVLQALGSHRKFLSWKSDQVYVLKGPLEALPSRLGVC